MKAGRWWSAAAAVAVCLCATALSVAHTSAAGGYRPPPPPRYRHRAPAADPAAGPAASAPSSTIPLNAGLEHVNLERTVQLQTHVEEVTVVGQVTNKGTSPAQSYVVAVPPSKSSGNLFSYLRGRVGGQELNLVRTDVSDPAAPEGTVFFRALLRKPMQPGETEDLSLLIIFTNTMRPLPSEIRQDDDQLVDWHDSTLFYSPYPTTKETTIVKLASDGIEHFTRRKPFNKDGSTITYGPFETTMPYTDKRLRIHFKNNAKFVTFTKVRRDITVSHWGDVNFEEKVWVRHSGARLTGPFERIDYERGRGSQASFNQLAAFLPRDARQVYYRDEIGNISDSHVRRERRRTVLEIEPRFPLFGGWKTDFETGFHLEAKHVLSRDATHSSTFVLNTTFSSPFQEAVVDQLTLRVILPEGSSDIQLFVPFAVDSEDRQVVKSYLDTVGRPTVVFRKTNLVHYHDDFFQVVYKFEDSTMVVEPLMLSGLFLVFFVVAIVVRRLDLSVTSSPHSKRE